MADHTQARQPLRISSISGGAGGTYAMLEEIQALAELTEEVGAGLAIIRSRCHDVVIDGDVLMSAVLNPAGVARFEATLLDAIDGPGGLTWLSAELQAHGPLLRKAAEAYRALDEGSERVFDSVAWLTGYAGVGVGLASLPLLLGTLLNPVTGLPLIVAGSQVDWNSLLRDNPALVQGIIRAAPGAVAAGQVAVRGALGALGPVGLALGPLVTGPIVTDVQSGAKLLGGFYPDGRPVVETVSEANPSETERTPPGSQVDLYTFTDKDGHVHTVKSPPRTFENLMDGYALRNAQAQEQLDGQIDIREIVKDGTTMYVVNLPGTYNDGMNLAPFEPHSGAPNDFGTNFRTLAGESTTYSDGVAQALRDIEYKAGSQIMIVGHSQGGMVAAQFASDPKYQEFNVTHLVTNGSPIAHVEIPPDVRVVSFENNGDPVPKLDGRDNPAHSNWTTVKIDDPQPGDLLHNHSMTNVYRPAGSYLDSNDHPSIQEFRDSASDFVNGTEVSYRVKTIKRDFP